MNKKNWINWVTGLSNSLYVFAPTLAGYKEPFPRLFMWYMFLVMTSCATVVFPCEYFLICWQLILFCASDLWYNAYINSLIYVTIAWNVVIFVLYFPLCLGIVCKICWLPLNCNRNGVFLLCHSFPSFFFGMIYSKLKCSAFSALPNRTKQSTQSHFIMIVNDIFTFQKANTAISNPASFWNKRITGFNRGILVLNKKKKKKISYPVLAF